MMKSVHSEKEEKIRRTETKKKIERRKEEQQKNKKGLWKKERGKADLAGRGGGKEEGSEEVVGEKGDSSLSKSGLSELCWWARVSSS